MIKIGKLFYIHYSTVIFFVICWFTRRLELLFISYLTVFLHEMAHFYAAILIGAEPSYIAFFPFGVNLKLKKGILYSISDEILLYMSGPLLNAVSALFLQIFLKKTVYIRYLYWNNIGLFIFNLLPILPMDGGMVLKRVLADRIGSRASQKTLKFISFILIVFLSVFEIFLLIQNSFNFPLLFVITFLTANIFTNNEKYNISLVRELLYIKEKKKRNMTKAEVYLISADYPRRKLAENFSMYKSYIVLEKDKKGKITRFLTEEEIIEDILKEK